MRMLNIDWLFLDMNAYFASVEQQLDPALRGRPVAVVPTDTDSTCCIAVSYEARPYGIRTGTKVGQAKAWCPDLVLVAGRHEKYIEMHHRICQAVETVLPIHRIWSVDEMACKLSPQHRSTSQALRIAGEVKRAIAEQVGSHLRCSVGLAPNRLLAKVASNMQKPDGLTMLTMADLPHRLYRLELRDLPGIGRGMEKRLASKGITRVRQLCALSRPQMRDAWNSVLGEQWWHWLRGNEVPEQETTRRTVGHSHVLAPKLRTDAGSKAVLVRLLHKAAARLRKMQYWAGRLVVSLRYKDGWPGWQVAIPLGGVEDTPTLLKAFEEAWHQRPAGGTPLQASITLTHLTPRACKSLPLFEEDRRAIRAAETIDRINAHAGPNAIYFASMHDTRESAPLRIAFNHIPDIDTESTGQ